MTTPALPRFIALSRAEGATYLEYVAREGAQHGTLTLTSRMLVSHGSFTKFEVVRGPSADTVHIRSCFNNKFLTLKHHSDNQLYATSDEPEEDTSKRSCTLFRRVFDGNSNRVRLFHISHNFDHPIVLLLSHNSLVVSTASFQNSILWNVIDMTLMVYLPRHVSFVGDNNLYLSSRHIRFRNRLKFDESNQFDRTVHHEVTTLNNGNVQLRSMTFNRQLWRKSNPEWIWCDTTDANDSDTVFRPEAMGIQGDKIALWCVSNHKHCMRWIRGGQPRLVHTLTASASSMVPQVELTVHEAIRDREIYDVRYRSDEARIYNVQPILSVPQTVDNYSYTETTQNGLSYSYEELTQETFSSSHSWKVDYSTKLNITFVPKLVTGEVHFQAQYRGDIKWSELHEKTETVSSSVQVPVPPRTRSVVTLVVGRGNIDIPYSFKQRDVLLDNTHVTTNFDDGLFTGLNTSVFHYDVREEKLTDGKEGQEEAVVIRRYIIKPETTSQQPPNTSITANYHDDDDDDGDGEGEEEEAKQVLRRPSKL